VKIEFWKYEGAGNDFILLDSRGSAFEPSAEQIHALCNRRTGIGADGLMMLSSTPRADFAMRYFNADGPEATMCGNGGRCIVWFADHLGIGGDLKSFEAIDGMHTAQILSREGDIATVRLGMVDVTRVEVCADGDVLLDTGSPHLVRVVEEFEEDIVPTGRALRYDAKTAPTGGANINFVKVAGEGSASLRTYERGVEDETLACGTGATATAIALCHTLQPSVRKFTLRALGGELRVEFDREGDHYSNIRLTGPARRVFRGEIEI